MEYTVQHVFMSELCPDVRISVNFYTIIFPLRHNSHVGLFQVVECRRFRLGHAHYPQHQLRKVATPHLDIIV